MRKTKSNQKVESTTRKIKSRPLLYQHEIPVTRITKFWDGLIEGKIYYTKCKKCGEHYYPPQVDCPKCLQRDVDWIPLSNEGVILSFTQTQLKPQGFTQYTEPYTIAIVESRDQVKVMGWLEKVESPKVGITVKISSRLQPDGFPIITFTATN